MINDRTYWEGRFSTGDWQDKGGEAQSAFFASVLMDALPDWLCMEMRRNSYAVTDYGCAEGAGTAYMAGRFPRCSFTGVDFSETAVEMAQKKHPSCNYIVGDLTGEIEESDIIVTSNTLEHFRNPMELLGNLVSHARHHAIFLLPFEDDLDIDEHLVIFDADTLSKPIEGYDLSFFKFIDCRPMEGTMWMGKQVLLIYSKQEKENKSEYCLGQIYKGTIQEYLEGRYEEIVNSRVLHGQVDQAAKDVEVMQAQCAEQRRAAENALDQLAQQKAQTDAAERKAQETAAELEETQGRLADAREQIRMYQEALQNSVARADIMGQIRAMRAESAEMGYWLDVAGRSEPMRIAHFFVQLKHALFGTKEERTECRRWLRGERSLVTKYSYIQQSAVRAANLHARIDALQGMTCSLDVDNEPMYDRHDFSKENVEELKPLAEIVEAYQGKSIIVLPELVDWNIPLFQRPQQLAMAFAELGVLFVYFTPNGNDNVHSVQKIMENCVLLPAEWFKHTIELLVRHDKDVILDVWSTDNKHFMPWVEAFRRKGCRILYEYIDEISEDITGDVPRETIERHHALLADENVFVVATADKLYNDVKRIRGSEVNTLKSSNGVDLKHFKVKRDDAKIPKHIRKIMDRKKPVIGYFGAIANWFDFELVEYAARQRPEYEFMMIGPHYGSHDLKILNELKRIRNLHFVGTVEYEILPHVASHFTVATIPFILNDITESTSPIKLFEYMAMDKPVVTTAMRECFKYPVVRIAKDRDDYVAALDELIGKAQDKQYLEEIADTAKRNSWLKKAEEIQELLRIGV